jgi:hypothetical protein
MWTASSSSPRAGLGSRPVTNDELTFFKELPMITSTNRNSCNHSTYARHRSITKGSQQLLRKVVADFKTARDKLIFEEFGNFLDFSRAWGGGGCLRVAAGPLYVCKLDSENKPAKTGRVQNNVLKSDLQIILSDINVMQTMQKRWVAEEDSKSSVATYICAFLGTNRLEIIASKWGFTPGHHFYHWQAIDRGANLGHVVAVDDLNDGDDTSNNSANKHDAVMQGLRDALPFM